VRWEKSKLFRDIVWETALQKVDLRTPAIVDGVVAQAERGRVDAAKFALSLLGRYSEDKTSIAVAVKIDLNNGVPRPMPQTKHVDVEIEDAELEE